MRDLIAIFGVLLILLGFYFIYWPISLVLGGLVLTSYCLIATYQERFKDEDT